MSTNKLKSLLLLTTSVVSIISFLFFLYNGLGLAYNDARSHLNIGRRVVESLQPGFAQIGSVWLPLPHILMIPTVWNDTMWQSGLSGALPNMVSYVLVCLSIFAYLNKLKVGKFASVLAVLAFGLNLNILYLQSTAMTEILLLFTLLAGTYYLLVWSQDESIFNLVKSAAWIMLATLIRYDGWFLAAWAAGVIILITWKKGGAKLAEGSFILFSTLAGFGIFLWLTWNTLIFKDPLYFALGPFSARSQQQVLESAGNLATKGNLILSIQTYTQAVVYNSTAVIAIFGFIGCVFIWTDSRLSSQVRIASSALAAPYVFNIIALFFGHSVLYLPDFYGNSWFNVRYGIMCLPSLAIGLGYLLQRLSSIRLAFVPAIAMTMFFAFTSLDAVTIDDARVGASQKNVSEVSDYLKANATNNPGFILVSAASHDAILFSTGLPLKRYIHEGTGEYWRSALSSPDSWARWIIMRTGDNADLTYRSIKNNLGLKNYNLVGKYPFADIYELKPEYMPGLIIDPILNQNK